MITTIDHLSKRRVLVVDDEKVTRELVARILGKAGYDVRVADSAAAALQGLRGARCDMIISDVNMPGMNGLDLLQEVKAEFPDVAFVAMTAHSDTYTIKDALMLGADEYITKPFKNYEVVVVVERAFWRIETARQ